MRFALFAFLTLLTLFSAGCHAFGSNDQVAPYEVKVLGPITGVATGAKANVRIQIHGTSSQEWGGWGSGPQVPSLSVDHVTCSPDCVATSAYGGTDYDVVATTAGARSVEVSYSTSDGKHATEVLTIDFRDATRIDARRGGTSPSGSVYAMVPGDTQWWAVSVADEKGPLQVDLCQPEVTSSGAVETDNTRCNESMGVSAVAPGSGTVTVRYGDLVRDVAIKVIDPTEIREVELRLVLRSSDANVAIESDDGLLAPLTTPLMFSGDCYGNISGLVVPRLTTADGTVAYGAANLLAAIPSNVRLEVYAQVAEVSFGKAVSGTFRGNFGSSASTTLSVPFVAQSDGSCDDGG
jgi:hypothetical protein